MQRSSDGGGDGVLGGFWGVSALKTCVLHVGLGLLRNLKCEPQSTVPLKNMKKCISAMWRGFKEPQRLVKRFVRGLGHGDVDDLDFAVASRAESRTSFPRVVAALQLAFHSIVDAQGCEV